MLKRFQQLDTALSTAGNATDLLVVPPVEGDSTLPSGQSAAIALLLGLSVGIPGDGDRYATFTTRASGTLSTQIAAQPFAGEYYGPGAASHCCGAHRTMRDRHQTRR